MKKSQNSRNQCFPYYFFLDDKRIRIQIRISDLWIRIRIQETQKLMYPDFFKYLPYAMVPHRKKHIPERLEREFLH